MLRVDDTGHAFKLEGKQGYGPARGVWQTIYLEARGSAPLAAVHFTPWRDLKGLRVDARLLEPAPRALALSVTFGKGDAQPIFTTRIERGAKSTRLEIPISKAHRWSLDDPFLYQVTVGVGGSGLIAVGEFTTIG